jgi:hypothetical protein
MYLQKGISIKTFRQKKLFLLVSSGVRSGNGSASASRSVSHKYGFENPDPNLDPYQNVTDPEHWFLCCIDLNTSVSIKLPSHKIGWTILYLLSNVPGLFLSLSDLLKIYCNKMFFLRSASCGSDIV